MASNGRNTNGRAATGRATALKLVRVSICLALMTAYLAADSALAATTRSSPPAPGGGTIAVATPVSAMNGFSAEQLPQPQLNLQLATMEANGIRVVRSDAPWADIEPQPPGPDGPTWQFADTDAWVRALAAHHLAWEPIIDYSVWWAKNCPGFCVPSSNAAYATFAQAIAARYGVRGSFWSQNRGLPYYPAQIFEIWNEENTSMFWVDPAKYGPLYAAARAAIRSVDPQASVVVGGLADDSGTFNASQDYAAWYVLRMLVADPALKGSIDGFGLHPYGATALDVERWVSDFRYGLDVWGEGAAPIDITEVGWLTGDSSRELWRAAQMNAVAVTLSRSNCGIRLLAPYDWINPSSQEGDFGFVDSTGVDAILRPVGIQWFLGLRHAASLPRVQLCKDVQVRRTLRVFPRRHHRSRHARRHRRRGRR